MDKKSPVKKPAPARKTHAPTGAAPAKRTPASPTKPAPAKRPLTEAERAARRKARAAKKRRARRLKRLRIALIGLLCCVAVGVAVFFRMHASIGGQLYPVSTQTVDLRNRALTNADGLARLTGLQEALLSGNELTNVDCLTGLTDCRYIDLTGNPISDSACARLKEALPNCLILCEATDLTTDKMTLSGRTLPDAQTLIRTLSGYRALTQVDLRCTGLPASDVAALRAQLPHVHFITSETPPQGTRLIRLTDRSEAEAALAARPDAAHATIVGCAFLPDEYRALTARFPGMRLDCLISIDGVEASSESAELTLTHASADETLTETLRLFPNLKRLTLGETQPDAAQQLRNTLNLEEIRYTYLGQTISSETAEIDLRGASELTAGQLEALMEAAPNVKTVRIDSPDAAQLAVVDRYVSRVHFAYETEAFGRRFSTGDRTLDLGDAVTDSDVDELMRLLDRMHALEEIDMYESTLSQESMDRLFDRYPNVFFGWTFTMCNGRYKLRTDATAFSTMLGKPRNVYTQEDFAPLRFCTRLEALDLGHNAITDLSFIGGLTQMKALILADNAITDLSPVASMKELQYVELFMNDELTDYSPLAGLPLTDLNVRCEADERHTLNVEQFMGMTTLERFWASTGSLTEEEQERLQEALPDCKISITESHSTGNGWRTTERHEVVKRIFERGRFEPLP